jgi:hypothetical protein
LGTTINQVPQFDAVSFREILATEVRAGVLSAGRDRWSTELLSTMIEKFLDVKKRSKLTPPRLRGSIA